jgi:hypothetical protein
MLMDGTAGAMKMMIRYEISRSRSTWSLASHIQGLERPGLYHPQGSIIMRQSIFSALNPLSGCLRSGTSFLGICDQPDP